MSWELIETTSPIARKEHKCEWCGEPILKGEKHHRETGKFDGNFTSYRMHLECRDAVSKTANENHFHFWVWDPMINPRGVCDEESLWEY